MSGPARGPEPGRRRSTPLDRVPPEARVFVEMALFGLIVGGLYWFLTYESAGSVLLGAFGLAAAISAVAITIGASRGRRDGRAHDRASGPEARPSGSSAGEPLPGPGWTPILVGIGLGGVALGAAFGPWLAIAGLLVTVVGARGWLDAAMAETDAARDRVGRDASIRDGGRPE